MVEQAVDLFEAANGAVRVADVCKQLGADPRHLHRRFTHIVGLSPKFFGQALQINWVVGLLYFKDTATSTDIAHTAGFHDLSHFHRTMRRFFNEGPREFLQSDHLLVQNIPRLLAPLRPDLVRHRLSKSDWGQSRDRERSRESEVGLVGHTVSGPDSTTELGQRTNPLTRERASRKGGARGEVEPQLR